MLIFSSYGFTSPVVAPKLLELLSSPCKRQILLIPFASGGNAIQKEIDALKNQGFGKIDILSDGFPIIDKGVTDIYVIGGDPFKLNHMLKERKLFEPIRSLVLSGVNYIGVSAGAYTATSDIGYVSCLEDDNYYDENKSALSLTDKIIICHADSYPFQMRYLIKNRYDSELITIDNCDVYWEELN